MLKQAYFAAHPLSRAVREVNRCGDLDYICAHVQRDPNHTAIRTSSGRVDDLCRALAGFRRHCRASVCTWTQCRSAVVVRGHKSPYMVASFLACMKSGHPYVPVDIHSVPAARVASIAEQVGGELLLSVEGDTAEVQSSFAQVIDARRDLCGCGIWQRFEARILDLRRGLGIRAVYVWLYGRAQGCGGYGRMLDNFCGWDLILGGTDKEGCVFLDQAPFSFDLSVFELAGALAQAEACSASRTKRPGCGRPAARSCQKQREHLGVHALVCRHVPGEPRVFLRAPAGPHHFHLLRRDARQQDGAPSARALCERDDHQHLWAPPSPRWR